MPSELARGRMNAVPPRLLAALLTGFAFAACGSTELEVQADEYPPVESASFGTMHNVSLCEYVWVGAAPQEEDFELASRRGVRTVVDLSSPEDSGEAPAPGFDAGAVCRRLGLDYVHPQGLDAGTPGDECVDFVLGILESNGDQPTLMYCGTGRRSATFLAIYRATELGVPLDDAIAEARRAGMRPEDETFVSTQVERRLGPR